MSGTVWRAPAHCPGLGLPPKRPVLILEEYHQFCWHKDRRQHHRCVECTKKDRTTILICHCWSTLGGCKLLLVIDQGEHIEVATEVSATIRGELLRGSLETVFYGAKANV
jgi:hypothetical protein